MTEIHDFSRSKTQISKDKGNSTDFGLNLSGSVSPDGNLYWVPLTTVTSTSVSVKSGQTLHTNKKSKSSKINALISFQTGLSSAGPIFHRAAGR